jgi:hypothetical protein
MAEALRPRPLGLDQLSPRGISLLREFVELNGTTGLSEAFDEELRTMPERDVENARTTFEALADSDDSEDRLALCFIVPGLASGPPDLTGGRAARRKGNDQRDHCGGLASWAGARAAVPAPRCRRRSACPRPSRPPQISVWAPRAAQRRRAAGSRRACQLARAAGETRA